MIIGGIALFATYPGVVKYLPAIMTAIAGDNITVEILILIALLLVLDLEFIMQKQSKPTLHLTFMSFCLFLLDL